MLRRLALSLERRVLLVLVALSNRDRGLAAVSRSARLDEALEAIEEKLGLRVDLP